MFNTAQVSDTESFIKGLTNLDKVLSYINHDGDLRMWIVNVTSSQLAEIQKNDGVSKTEQNYFPKKPRELELENSPENLAPRDDAESWIIFSKNGFNESEIETTENFLNTTCVPQSLRRYTFSNKEVPYWVVVAAQAQIDTITKYPGVRAAELDASNLTQPTASTTSGASSLMCAIATVKITHTTGKGGPHCRSAQSNSESTRRLLVRRRQTRSWVAALRHMISSMTLSGFGVMAGQIRTLATV